MTTCVCGKCEQCTGNKLAGLVFVGCQRSHPHEDMDGICTEKTKTARSENSLAHANQEIGYLQSRVSELEAQEAVLDRVDNGANHGEILKLGGAKFCNRCGGLLSLCAATGGLCDRCENDVLKERISELEALETTLTSLLRECGNTLDVWSDVAPAVSLLSDIKKTLTTLSAAKEK